MKIIEEKKMWNGLFMPLRVGSVELQNRLIMAPMSAFGPVKDGFVADQTVAFFEERAKHGIGLIIVGGSVGTTIGWKGTLGTRINTLRLDEDQFVPGLRRVTEAVHRHHVPIFSQIIPTWGALSKVGPYHVAASPVPLITPEENLSHGMTMPGGFNRPAPRAATIEEIKSIEHEVVQTVCRMRSAGFDGVELGAHMNYFLTTFLSPRTNRRTDEYGGSAENRARVVTNIIRAVRSKIGSGYPVGVRMPVNEHLADGSGPEEFAELAVLFQDAGASYIAMTDGTYGSMMLSTPQRDMNIIEHGEAKIFRAKVSIPLFMQGVHKPENIVTAITSGHCDAVMLGRPLLADPAFPAKLREGKAAEINHCDRQNLCLRRVFMSLPVRCSMNPRAGLESHPAGTPPTIGMRSQALAESATLWASTKRPLMRIMMKLGDR
jgi:2,4-dienoyl-CoA reductase-like NADH-dependent reductase (Old Yellow Enzyme family)